MVEFAGQPSPRLPFWELKESILETLREKLDLSRASCLAPDALRQELRSLVARFCKEARPTLDTLTRDMVINAVLDELPAGGRVLDVGCGTGEQVRHCGELGFRVTGIEPSASMRAVAQRLNPGVPILDGTITRLPFQQDTFDGVLAMEVLRYLHPIDIHASYREILRVLKPGGVAFFTMVNRYALDGYYLYYALTVARARLLGRESPAHCEFVTPGEVRQDLGALGVTDVEAHGRMLASLRLVYKVNERLGALAARLVEPLDDALCGQAWMAPLAGHLVLVIRRP